MRKHVALLGILGSFLWIMGMGNMGGENAVTAKIPAPEKNYNVRVVDRQDIQTPLTRFSQDGKVFITGRRGDATVAIPFDKIAQIQFSGQEGKELQAKILLKDQKGIEVTLDKQLKFFGQADFGTFQIEAKGLKSISFQP
jgi:hypothetical protein